jgi:hypothetical protein
MPTRPSKNVVGKYLEFPTEIAEEVDGFAKSRGQTFRAVVIEALRRHMDNPPPPPKPPELPPLPPVTVPSVEVKAEPAKPAARKGKK